MNKLFVFGFGFSSTAIAQKAAPDFDVICGTSRSAEKAGKLSDHGCKGLVFAGEKTDELLAELKDTTHLLISIAPGETDPVLAAFPDLLESAPNLQWVGYLSTVGVYGDHDGAWVDEETPPRPVSKRSVERVNAENAWHALFKDTNVPFAIFRLAGIYGPGRNWFVNIEKGKSRRLVKKDQVFNRIHREDIGSAVTIAMRRKIGGIFNITDNEPAPPQDVVVLAHELMGKSPPPEVDFETADISPMARSFYGENKRVSNTKSRQVLGMEYAWPDYRTALQRMWREGSWKPV